MSSDGIYKIVAAALVSALLGAFVMGLFHGGEVQALARDMRTLIASDIEQDQHIFYLQRDLDLLTAESRAAVVELRQAVLELREWLAKQQ